MKRVKRIAVLLAAVLVLMTACAANEAPKGSVESAQGTSAEETKDEATEAGTAGTEEAADDTAAEDEAFEIGGVSDNVYKNDFFGVSCKLPEGWEVYDEEQIAEMTAAVQDVFSDSEEVQNLLDGGGSFYDLYAVSGESLQQINVVLGKMSLPEQLAVKASGIETVMEEAINRVGTVLAGTPMEDAEITLTKVEFMGETRPCMEWYVEQESEYGTIPTYQKQFMMAGGSYNMTITCTSYLEDTTDEMLGLFTSIDK